MSETSSLRLSGRQPTTVSADLRRVNAGAVLRSVLVDGPLARAELAERLRLTRATVTRVAEQLLSLDLLSEKSPVRASAGRPMVPLEISGASRVALAVHIGAFELRVGAVDLQGRVISELRHRYTDPSPDGVAQMISSALSDLSNSLPPSLRSLGISASIGGWVDPVRREIVEYEPLGWRGVPIESLLPESSLPRFFDQFAHGLALAEGMYGTARNVSDFLEIWTGNVVSSAIVADGVVRRGAQGAAGAIEHLPTQVATGVCTCGRTDCLRSVLTDGAIVRSALQIGVLESGQGLDELIKMAVDDHPGARSLLEDRGRVFARAIAPLAEFVSPDHLVIAGTVTLVPSYVRAFEEQLGSSYGRAGRTPVSVSRFGDTAPTVASAAFLLSAFIDDPLGFEPEILT